MSYVALRCYLIACDDVASVACDDVASVALRHYLMSCVVVRCYWMSYVALRCYQIACDVIWLSVLRLDAV